MSSSATADPQSDALRERKIPAAHDGESSPVESSGANTPQTEEEIDKTKKTFGRTPNGTSKLRPGVHG
jgi:hypothetical protein